MSSTPRPGRVLAWQAVSASLAIQALSTGAFAAPDNKRELSGPQIKAVFAGKILTDGIHWSAYLLRDGTFKSVEMGRSRKGRWKIDGDELCLSAPAGAGFECWTVVRSGGKYVFRTNGQAVFEVTTEAPSPKYRFD
jgi:hypothetical protein